MLNKLKAFLNKTRDVLSEFRFTKQVAGTYPWSIYEHVEADLLGRYRNIIVRHTAKGRVVAEQIIREDGRQHDRNIQDKVIKEKIMKAYWDDKKEYVNAKQHQIRNNEACLKDARRQLKTASDEPNWYDKSIDSYNEERMSKKSDADRINEAIDQYKKHIEEMKDDIGLKEKGLEASIDDIIEDWKEWYEVRETIKRRPERLYALIEQAWVKRDCRPTSIRIAVHECIVGRYEKKEAQLIYPIYSPEKDMVLEKGIYKFRRDFMRSMAWCEVKCTNRNIEGIIDGWQKWRRQAM